MATSTTITQMERKGEVSSKGMIGKQTSQIKNSTKKKVIITIVMIIFKPLLVPLSE